MADKLGYETILYTFSYSEIHDILNLRDDLQVKGMSIDRKDKTITIHANNRTDGYLES